MPRLDTGSIDYQVPEPITVDDLAGVATAGAVEVDDNCKDALLYEASSFAEHQMMYRPDYASVKKLLENFIRLATAGKRELFFELLTKTARASDETQPSEAYVYHAIVSEFDIRCETYWREDVLAGKVAIGRVRIELQKILRRVEGVYFGTRGGKQEHDLGPLIYRLAQIYKNAGGKVTAPSVIRPENPPECGLWVVDSPFVRFASAFIALLPKREGVLTVNVGNLIARALPSCAEAQKQTSNK